MEKHHHKIDWVRQMRRNGATINSICKDTGLRPNTVCKILRISHSNRSLFANIKTGLIFRPGSLWIGVHWSKLNKRLCINIIPCITWWVTLAGGNTPNKDK